MGSRKLPRIPKDAIPNILQDAAKKIERGEPLLVGRSRIGDPYLEGAIVATVLRAVAAALAEGKDEIKLNLKELYGEGSMPEHHLVKLKRFEEAFAKHGGNKTAAFKAMARKAPLASSGKQRTYLAFQQDHKRALKAQRDRWRRAYLSGQWPNFPGSAWRMTDSEIEAQILADKMTDASSARTNLHARRNAELQVIRDLTGWKTLPQRKGDKSPPS